MCLKANGGACHWYKYNDYSTWQASRFIKRNMFSVQNEKYNGWDVVILQSQWLKLYVAPQLGGRLMQLELNGYPFFFVNSKLAGKVPDETRLGENSAWLNWGGEKIWPAPQGWDSTAHWPGPPDPVLDGGEYQCSKVKHEEYALSFTLTSSFDSYSGLQIEKKVMLQKDEASICIQATFYNRTNKPIRWSIWPVCQLNAPALSDGNKYVVVCPVNPHSAYEDGFKVMHGLVNNPQNSTDDEGNLVVHFQYLVGKTGLDANCDWVAFQALNTGKVFVYRYTYEPGENYPENTSVQIWTQGRGQIFSRHRVVEFKDDQDVNPPYVELELLSPVKEIQPGAGFLFNYCMQVSTVPEAARIKTITKHAVICGRLELITSGMQFEVSGQYGVFQQGILLLQILDKDGRSLQTYQQRVSPIQGAKLLFPIDRNTVFTDELKVCLTLLNEDGKNVGIIEQQHFKLGEVFERKTQKENEL